MDTELTYENYLAHHGIKGMRWGVRRKEGSDGTVGSGGGGVESINKSKMADDSSSEGESTPKSNNSARNKKIAIGAGVAALAVGAAIGGVAAKNIVDTKRIEKGRAQVNKISKMSLTELYLETAPKPTAKTPTRSNRAAKRDTKLYGDRGSKRIERSINRGQSPRRARNRENVRAGASFMVRAGLNAAMSR